MAKIKIEEIREEIEQKGWKLNSETYKNLEEELHFTCPENHSVYNSWKKMRMKLECPICKQNSFKLQGDSTKIIAKKKESFRVLGIDQATYKCGYAIADNDKLITHGVFETNLNDEIARDHEIKNWLISMISNWKPDFICLEGIQLQENSAGQRIMGVTVFETLARLQGILMETCFEYDVPFEICPTATWRNYCGVRGRTRVDRKRSMQLLIKEWYDATVTDDVADAIGITKYGTSNGKIKSIKIENWE